jgi:hypothetical protein
MTDQSTVERVAKAIFREGFHADEPESVVAAKWEEWPESRQQCRRKARAAVAVVLEDVAEMLERNDMNSAGYMAGEVRSLKASVDRAHIVQS